MVAERATKLLTDALTQLIFSGASIRVLNVLDCRREALEKWVGPGGGSAAPAAAPSGKTGWEALDKWVGGSGAQAGGPSGKTGWEALDKWVGSGGAAAPSAQASAGNGAAASADAPAAEPAGSGGFVGFLKRLFGGK
jgi:hypothetical protein